MFVRQLAAARRPLPPAPAGGAELFHSSNHAKSSSLGDSLGGGFTRKANLRMLTGLGWQGDGGGVGSFTGGQGLRM